MKRKPILIISSYSWFVLPKHNIWLFTEKQPLHIVVVQLNHYYSFMIFLTLSILNPNLSAISLTDFAELKNKFLIY